MVNRRNSDTIKTMNGIIYVRVSSDEQVLGTSLASQEEVCLKYCADKKIEVVEVFREEGASAKTANRPELLRALEMCRKRRPKIEAFVVAKVDRFARNTEDHFTVRGMLKRYGVNLHSVTEPIGNSPTERLLETVLAGSAEFDNAIRTQRSMDGMKSQLRRGIWPWSVPVGYLCAGTKKMGVKKLSPDGIDPHRFPIIQRGLQAYAAGNIQSMAQLVKVLNRAGLTSAQGKRIRSQMVDRMLSSYLAFYSGSLLDPFSGDELPGGQTPMITVEERRRIQLMRAGKYRAMKPRDRAALKYPLRRTVLCTHCGRPLTASSPRGRTKVYAYYHCATKMCVGYGRSFPQRQVEMEFGKMLCTIRPKVKTLTAVAKALVGLSSSKRAFAVAKKVEINHSILKLRNQRERIFEMREDGSYSKEQFLERLRKINLRLDSDEEALSQLEIGPNAFGPLIAGSLMMLGKLMTNWTSLSTEHKRRFQRVIFPQGISYDSQNGFGTAKMSYVFETIRGFARSKSRGVTPTRSGWNRFDPEGIAWLELIEELKELNAIHGRRKSPKSPRPSIRQKRF